MWFHFISRQTILLKLDTLGASELVYQPGDHVGIFPANQKNQVDAILSKLSNAPPSDELVKIEVLQERSTPLGKAVFNFFLLNSRMAWSDVEKQLKVSEVAVGHPLPWTSHLSYIRCACIFVGVIKLLFCHPIEELNNISI